MLERNLWLIYALATFFFWGYFSPHLTLASRAFGLRLLIVNGGVMLGIGLIAVVLYGEGFSFISRDAEMTKNLFLGCVASALGYLFFSLGLDNAKKFGGRVNAVVVICGMWIALAVVQNWRVLGEEMTPLKWIGVLFAVFAVICISK